MQVNNTIYETYGASWWDEDAPFDFASLRYSVNPARYAYFTTVLARAKPIGRRVLDVGCGGGFLSEMFARDGYEVAGIDPAVRSIEAARRHASAGGLTIDYRVARGESLPFPDGTFDIVACCDVLEHVDDVERVVSEVSRVLGDGGILLFDTVNRTAKAWFALIKLWQDWDIVGLGEPNVHVWAKFIRPRELVTMLAARGLRAGELRGLAPASNPLSMLRTFHRIRRGRLPNSALAGALRFRVTGDLSVSYIGTARKAPRTAG